MFGGGITMDKTHTHEQTKYDKLQKQQAYQLSSNNCSYNNKALVAKTTRAADIKTQYC